MTDWQVCPYCPPEDNMWPPEAFKAAGGPWPEGKRPCNSCFTAMYPKRRVNCTSCGGRMETRGHAEEPTCLVCRRMRAEERRAAKAEAMGEARCGGCGKAWTGGGRFRDRRCRECHQRQRAKLRKVRAAPRTVERGPEGISFEGFRFSRHYEEAA